MFWTAHNTGPIKIRDAAVHNHTLNIKEHLNRDILFYLNLVQYDEYIYD